MSFDYLNEAFKKLSFLNEETFDTSLTGLNQLSDFMDKDASDDVIKVIDTEAEFEDEVQDSYIGKVITNCNVCHSHIFENKDEIVIDEDGLVNPEKPCPYCGEQAGFTIVGEITPYVKETEDPKADPTVKIDGEEVPTESDESVDESLLGGIGLAVGAGLAGGAANTIGKHVASKVLGASDDAEKEEKEEKEPLEEGIGGALVGGALGASAGKGLIGKAVGGVAGAIAGSHIQNKLSEDEEDVDEGLGGALVGGALGAATGGGLLGTAAGAIAGSHIQNKLSECESDLDEAGAAVLDRPREKDLTKIQGTIADVLINHSAEIDACGANETAVKDCIARILSSNEVKTPEAAEEAIRIIGKCRGPRLWSTIGTYMSGIKVGTGSRYAKRRLDASLEEDVNNVSVETDDSVVNIQSEEGGKVTVSTEPKAPETTGEEAIGPLSDETVADIESANGLSDAPVEGEEATDSPEEGEDSTTTDDSTEGGEEEMDIEEVDETAIDELGESYLKEVYENVDSFKTSNVSSTDTHLVVEGVIRFKSGAQKKTGFIFEAHSVTPDGKVRFTGKNEHFSRGAKSFILTGKIENKKLISESFTYNYRAKTSDGKSSRIYGTVNMK